jgi:hypothetical protein
MTRIFGFLAMVIAMAVALYLYARQSQGISEAVPGATLQSTVNIAGVKNDLIVIANAERAYMAQQSRYASLEELAAAEYSAIPRGRPPYSYSVQVSEAGFRVIATRSGPGGPSELSIDETMQITSSQ